MTYRPDLKLLEDISNEANVRETKRRTGSVHIDTLLCDMNTISLGTKQTKWCIVYVAFQLNLCRNLANAFNG